MLLVALLLAAIACVVARLVAVEAVAVGAVCRLLLALAVLATGARAVAAGARAVAARTRADVVPLLALPGGARLPAQLGRRESRVRCRPVAAVPLLDLHELGQDVVEGERRLAGGLHDGDDGVVDGGQALQHGPDDVVLLDRCAGVGEAVLKGLGSGKVFVESLCRPHLDAAELAPEAELEGGALVGEDVLECEPGLLGAGGAEDGAVVLGRDGHAHVGQGLGAVVYVVVGAGDGAPEAACSQVELHLGGPGVVVVGVQGAHVVRCAAGWLRRGCHAVEAMAS